MSDKPYLTVPGTVAKLIESALPSEPEKVQIQVQVADHLYRDLRIENKLLDEHGKEVHLKPGAEVEITVEAAPEATTAVDRLRP